mgnify:CR=1 FL=1
MKIETVAVHESERVTAHCLQVGDLFESCIDRVLHGGGLEDGPRLKKKVVVNVDKAFGHLLSIYRQCVSDIFVCSLVSGVL